MEPKKDDEFPAPVELNVGGSTYTTTLKTLTKFPDTKLAKLFTEPIELPKDRKGRYFLDRDGPLFRLILDFIRHDRLTLPECFYERERLKQEAEYYNLPELVKSVDRTPFPKRELRRPPSFFPNTSVESPTSPGGSMTDAGRPGYITIGYRGSFAFGREGLTDVKFRKLTRILVNGRVTLCREVFGDTLNESRDPDRVNENRYTARFFLKHNFLEQAFDNLQEAGFHCVAAAGSGTSGSGNEPLKPGIDFEENRWNHYNEFVFVRP